MIIYVNPTSFNPSTGEVNAEFGSTTDSEFQAAIEYAKTAQGNWAATTPMDRSDILRRAADLLDKYREERIPTMKLKIPGKAFFQSESRTSVTFKL